MHIHLPGEDNACADGQQRLDSKEHKIGRLAAVDAALEQLQAQEAAPQPRQLSDAQPGQPGRLLGLSERPCRLVC